MLKDILWAMVMLRLPGFCARQGMLAYRRLTNTWNLDVPKCSNPFRFLRPFRALPPVQNFDLLLLPTDLSVLVSLTIVTEFMTRCLAAVVSRGNYSTRRILPVSPSLLPAYGFDLLHRKTRVAGKWYLNKLQALPLPHCLQL